MITNYFVTKFLNNVAQAPNRNAIEIGSFIATYQTVFEDVALLSYKIKTSKLNDRPLIIGILSYKNYAAYISIATSQFIGATFVPLNINFPISRNIEIIKLSGINCLIYDDASAKYFESLNSEINQENLISIKFDDYIIQDPTLKTEIITKFNNATDNNTLVKSQSHAYIMFTSGSTGSIKWVNFIMMFLSKII